MAPTDDPKKKRAAAAAARKKKTMTSRTAALKRSAELANKSARNKDYKNASQRTSDSIRDMKRKKVARDKVKVRNKSIDAKHRKKAERGIEARNWAAEKRRIEAKHKVGKQGRP